MDNMGIFLHHRRRVRATPRPYNCGMKSTPCVGPGTGAVSLRAHADQGPYMLHDRFLVF